MNLYVRLRTGRSGVRNLARASEFPLALNVQTGSEAHIEGTGVSSGLGLKLTSHVQRAAKFKNEWRFTSTPCIRLHGVDKKNFIFSLF